MNVDQIIGELVDEREGGLGTGRGVDDVVAGGRRRARRRRIGQGAAGAGLVAAVAAVA